MSLDIAVKALAVLFVVTTPVHAAPTHPLVATQITEANAARTIPGGPDAIGGLDDWALQNGEICAVVADPSHESDALTTGGTLIDLGLCGRDDDQFVLYVELLNNSADSIVGTERVEATVENGVARITAFGRRDGVDVETRYELDRKKPRRLRIETHVTPGPEAIDLSGFSGVTLNFRGLTPFSVSTTGDEVSYGYAYPAYRDRGLGDLADAAAPVDVVVGVGSAELEPGIAYGQRMRRITVRDADGTTRDLPRFFLSDAFATILLGFSESFWMGSDRDLGWLELVQSQMMDLPEGSTLILEQEIWVGDRADVASVTDLLFWDSPIARGRTDAEGAVVHIDRTNGNPLTERRVGADHTFALHLPPGEYVARVVAPGGRRLRREFAVTEEGADLGLLSVGAPAEIVLPRGAPMRLVFVGQDGTEDPDFGDDLRGYRAMEDDEPTRILAPRRSLHRMGTDADPETVTVHPGRYRVLATRGPEFSLESATIDALAGARTTLEIDPPRRVLETPGIVASDFHIHSAPSLDNATPTAGQVANSIASGSEVLISSEHDHVFDFAPTIARLGLSSKLPSLVGLEVTSEVSTDLAPRSIGHANVFPVPVAPLSYRRGAVANEGRRWRDVIADLRALPGQRVIQLNHARTSDDSMHKRAFLTHMGPADAAFDPGTPLREAPNEVLIEPDATTTLRDLDFDAMELLNGHHMGRYEKLREDWFALLRQGEDIVGTANSDSHFTTDPVATPRNYVDYPGEVQPASKFDSARFVNAVLEGRLFGTTGPLVAVSLDGARPGDTLRAGKATLRVDVRSAPWVDVGEVRVYVNGEVVESRRIASDGRLEFPLEFAEDAFVTTEVWGEPSEDYQLVLPDFTPFAFTNPIWIDADADGTWAHPG